MNGSFNPVFWVEKESWTYHHSFIRNKRKYDAEMFQMVTFPHCYSLFSKWYWHEPKSYSALQR